MASAALPLLFPAVKLAGSWHGDGGVRLTTPLAPAIHLGARRIIAVSTRYDRAPPKRRRPRSWAIPPPAQIGGILLLRSSSTSSITTPTSSSAPTACSVVRYE